MGMKGKLLGRLKRRSQKPSDQSTNTTASATNYVVPATPTRGNYSVIDPSPTRLPVRELDPDAGAADDSAVPLTPSAVKNRSDGAQVSPDHTNSTQSCSVKSEVPIWDANDMGRDAVVPSIVVEDRPTEAAQPQQYAEDKNIFAEIASKAFKLVKKESTDKKEANLSLVEISDEKSVKLVNLTEVAATFEVEGDPQDKILPKETVDDKLNHANSVDRNVLEVLGDPIDLDDYMAFEEASAKIEKTSSDRAEDVVTPPRSLPKENIDSTESKVTPFGRVFNRGSADRKAGEKEGNLDMKNTSEGKKRIRTAAEEKSKPRPASPVKPSIHENAAATSQEEGNIQSSLSEIKAIEKQYLTNSPSEEGSTKSRKVSFDESHHVDHPLSEVEEEDDSSDGSEEDYDDDSHYFDDREGDGYDDDHIDEATHTSGDSIILNHDDGGVWAWLCGYDHYSTSPKSIEDKYEEKSVATIATDDGRESVLSVEESVDIDEGSTVDDGEEMSHNEEPFRVRQSSATLAHKLRAVAPSTKMPSLLKKKVTKQERTIIDQPRDSQGFPLNESKSTKSLKSRGEKGGKKEHIKNDDGSITSASYKMGGRQKSSKDTRQLEIYCKRHGSVENLVLRKYPSIPLPAGNDHILVKVEASTVSSRDCLLRLQGDPKQEPSPSVPGFQIVGTVFALGAGLKSKDVWRRGDRVAALTNGGGNARYVSIPASDAILLPPNATHEGLVCLVSNYMTAYQSLKLAKMKKGGAPLTNCNVLITGGSGPVGQALIDLATREGARVITTAHQMHEEHLTKNLG
ncbi:hypothetical protein ACHAWX_001232, partial [Stephanocyclus meneghinianus]